MRTARAFADNPPWIIVAAAALFFAGYCGPVSSEEINVALSGGQEIPPVTTSGSGTGIISVGADKSVRGSVTIAGMTPTVAHIHVAPAGTNGPIVIPLVQSANNVWSVPEGAKLTDAQYESYRAGNLYYNVHSAAYKGGEIRGQIKP
jgi:CHRD domain